ncbi:hypothetical protein RJ55_03915 [Drechmeria coniospora]|nr:hypothetical protein RJ55_03915 [Drechmeria coniospora]
MAEPAHAEACAPDSASDIKQEHYAPFPDGLDFSLSPDIALKRSFDEVGVGATESPEAKRTKVEVHADEDSLEDGLALLVQNALSNVGDLVDQFSRMPDVPETPAMPTNTDVPALDIVKPRALFSSDPQRYIQEVNLHALGNLALSLLLVMVQPPLDETIKSIRNAESCHGRSYRQLKQSFEQTRRLYSPKPVVSANELDMHDANSAVLLELANLAQLGSWLVEGCQSSLDEADENFLAMFGCQVSDLPAGMEELYLGIMTQRAVESLVGKQPEKPSEEVLGEILMSGLEDKLRGQHGGDELTSADQQFVSTVQSRKETLQGEAEEQPEPTALREKHPLEGLLRTYAQYVKKRLRSVSELATKFGILLQVEDDPTIEEPEPSSVEHVDHVAGVDVDVDLDDLSSFFEKTTSGLVQDALAGLATSEEGSAAAPATDGAPHSAEQTNGETKMEGSSGQTNGKVDLMTDYKELEALVAESTSNYVKTTLHGLSPVPYQPTVPQSTTESMASQLPYLHQLQQHQAQNPYYATYAQPAPEPQAQPRAPGENLPPHQSFPSAILYDKARQAALSKSSAHTRREGLHSTRRPWTQEEEKALMAGLDMVKGPHWSQILTLFGPSGTMSDILKDRTQVQLKDKARNLKLFFLKTNSEMPYYLQAVTGELKTRAPTQAARKEAEERARLTSEEDQAKLQGIMALAGGLQHPPQDRSSGSPAIGTGSNVVPTPGQAVAGQQTASVAQRNQHAPAQATAAPNASPAQAARLGVQATTQQVLQSMPLAPLRPHTQSHRPPQPQGYGNQPLHHQATHHYLTQQQQQQQQQQRQPVAQPSPSPSVPHASPGSRIQAQNGTQLQIETPAQAQTQSHMVGQVPAAVPAQTQARAPIEVQTTPVQSQGHGQAQAQPLSQSQPAQAKTQNQAQASQRQEQGPSLPSQQAPSQPQQGQNAGQQGGPTNQGRSLQTTDQKQVAQSNSATPVAAAHSHAHAHPQAQNPQASASNAQQSPQAQHTASVSLPTQMPLSGVPAAEGCKSKDEMQHNDNAAEAALLEGLQAAVAQSLS